MYLPITIILVTLRCVGAAKPNILILIADDMGYGDLGCYGNSSVRTPNIDGLAADGVKMTQHLTAASVCSPSRAALLTGRYPIRTGMAPTGLMRVNTWPFSSAGLPSSEVTYAEQAKQAGYKNGLFGKWHMGLHKDTLGDNVHHPYSQGFDYFYGLIGTNLDDFGHETKVITSMRPYWYWELVTTWTVTAIALRCLLKGKMITKFTFILALVVWTLPTIIVWFVFDNYTVMASIVHRNYDVVEQPIRLAGLSQRLVHEGLEFMENVTKNGEPFLIVMSWVHMHVHIETAKPFRGRSSFGRYGDALEELDWSVGEMLKGLKRVGVEDNTMVYFTSDNGGHIEIGTDGGYNGKLKGGKSHGAPDGGIRVPGIVKWPGVFKPNTVTDEPTSQMDIFPLISDAIGVKMPSDRKYDGKNILPLLKQETEVSAQEYLFHYCGDKLHAVRYRPRTGKTTWKYVTHEPPLIPGCTVCKFICSCNNAITLKTPKLYDVTTDPGETTPIDPLSKIYKDISNNVHEATKRHIATLDPVESQFHWSKLAPKLHWQPCCNGFFPFNCKCEDPRFPE